MEDQPRINYLQSNRMVYPAPMVFLIVALLRATSYRQKPNHRVPYTTAERHPSSETLGPQAVGGKKSYSALSRHHDWRNDVQVFLFRHSYVGIDNRTFCRPHSVIRIGRAVIVRFTNDIKGH